MSAIRSSPPSASRRDRLHELADLGLQIKAPGDSSGLSRPLQQPRSPVRYVAPGTRFILELIQALRKLPMPPAKGTDPLAVRARVHDPGSYASSSAAGSRTSAVGGPASLASPRPPECCSAAPSASAIRAAGVLRPRLRGAWLLRSSTPAAAAPHQDGEEVDTVAHRRQGMRAISRRLVRSARLGRAGVSGEYRPRARAIGPAQRGVTCRSTRELGPTRTKTRRVSEQCSQPNRRAIPLGQAMGERGEDCAPCETTTAVPGPVATDRAVTAVAHGTEKGLQPWGTSPRAGSRRLSQGQRAPAMLATSGHARRATVPVGQRTRAAHPSSWDARSAAPR